MLAGSIPVFRLAGFQVRIDGSWIVFAVLITWSLARGYFPSVYPGLPESAYWAMGFVGLIGLALSIVLHEFAHALVARRYELPVHSITLFIFGGVVEMEGAPPRPEAEFSMLAAGPIVSFLLALVFYILALVAIGGGVALLPSIALYLAYVNFTIAAFNLAPAFPLDGGRVLRAALWGLLGDFGRATQLAVLGGYILSAILIAMGMVWMLLGNLVRGAWWLMLGIFLATAARSTEYHERRRLNSR